MRGRSDTIAGPILQGHPWPIPQQILLRTRLTCCMFGKGFVTIDGPWPRRAACCRPAISGTSQGKPNSWRVAPSDFRFWRAKQFVVQSLGPQNSTLWHSVARPCAAQRLAARREKFSPTQHSELKARALVAENVTVKFIRQADEEDQIFEKKARCPHRQRAPT